MTKRTVKNHMWNGEVDPKNPTSEVYLYRCIAVSLGAWGAGDTPEEAAKNMRKAGGSIQRYIAYQTNSDKLTCEGSSLVVYPPEGGELEPGHAFDDINETRYVKGKGFATGRYNQVEWPDAKRKPAMA
jgi:hypothetical protein